MDCNNCSTYKHISDNTYRRVINRVKCNSCKKKKYSISHMEYLCDNDSTYSDSDCDNNSTYSDCDTFSYKSEYYRDKVRSHTLLKSQISDIKDKVTTDMLDVYNSHISDIQNNLMLNVTEIYDKLKSECSINSINTNICKEVTLCFNDESNSVLFNMTVTPNETIFKTVNTNCMIQLDCLEGCIMCDSEDLKDYNYGIIQIFNYDKKHMYNGVIDIVEIEECDTIIKKIKYTISSRPIFPIGCKVGCSIIIKLYKLCQI